MKWTIFSQCITVFVLIAIAFGGVYVHAQTSDDVENRRAQLEEELAGLEKEIEKQRSILEEQQRKTVSLERDVAILDAQIEEAELSIRARNIAIQKLQNEIDGKEQTIDSLSEKIIREKESLAQLIRKTHELDSFTLVEVVLSNEDLSEFFKDVDSFDAIKSRLQESFGEIEQAKTKNKSQKRTLEEKQREEQELRQIQRLQKQRIEEKRAERNRLLKITKGQEERYQEVLNEKERSAAEIRTELFALRGSDSIPFEKALALANNASEQTGVRPALILGVIREESNLGENVGNCNLPEDPPKYKWQNIMKSPRDTEPYLEVVKRLGLDPESMPLSCAPSYGYGGAMGPAQFIPSTWVLYEDRISKLTGNTPPNPWDPEDAFMAAAILLMDNGADKGTHQAERLAALRYFAGWKNASNPAYAFYGNDVMGFASEYQRNIDILQSS